MKKLAPHLPPKICLTPSGHRSHDLKLIIYSALIALAAGGAASLSLFNYFYPAFYDNNSVYIRSGRGGSSSGIIPELSANVVRDWRYQIVQIYDESKIIKPGIYPIASFAGKGVVLNSGGWVALYHPAWTKDLTRRFIGVDNLGARHGIEKFISDKENSIVYLKFDGEFRGTTVFADWKKIPEDKQVWIVNGEWNTGELTEIVDSGATVFPAMKIMSKYRVNDYLAHAGVVVNNRGDFVGFVDSSGRVIPSWLVQRHLTSILNTAELASGGVNWQGFFVAGLREGVNWKEIKGFYIAEGGQTEAEIGIVKGDILLEINDEPVSQASLARQIILAPTEFITTVWREGLEVKLLVKKEAK